MKTRGFGQKWYVYMVRFFALLLLLVLFNAGSSNSFAAGEQWRELTQARMSPRTAASAVYDAARQQMVLFGGVDGTGTLQDEVWALDLTPLSETWTRLQHGLGPSPRTQHTAVYDIVNERMIIFGGRTARGELEDDVWALDLSLDIPQWTRLPDGPAPREEHTAIYDQANQRMIVFGGVTADGRTVNDVWGLDLTLGEEAWTELSVGTRPTSRQRHTAIYDPFNQRMVAFGGLESDGTATNDVWALDLRFGQESWAEIEGGGLLPPNCVDMAAAYDPRNQRMIVYGGLDGTGRIIGETWLLDLTLGQETWFSPASIADTTPRHNHVAIYDPRDHRLVSATGLDLQGRAQGDTHSLDLTIDAPPSIRIVSPEDGATIDSSSLEVRVEIRNFILDPYRVDDGPNREDFGHWHLLLDGVYQTFVLGTLGIEATLTNLTPGEHTIKAELAENTHGLLGIADEVTINIPPQRPSIAILAPEDGLNTFDRDITVEVAVENFDLVDPEGQPPRPGEGHWHVRVDGIDQGAFISDTSYTIQNLPAGQHRITVELQNNNHLPFDPPVLDSVMINIRSPEIHIVSPQDRALINSSSVEVHVDVVDFSLDPDRVGGSNEPGFGHWHLFLDGVYQNFVTGTEGFAATLTELEPGPHEIRVELANNDHTALPFEEASDVVNITIAEGRPAVRIVQPDLPDREVAPWGQKVVLVNSGTLEITIEVENFILDAEGMDGPPVPGHGHWHLWVDGALQLQTAETSAAATGLTPGYHRIVVTLTNNDHTELDPPVIDTFMVLRPHRVSVPFVAR